MAAQFKTSFIPKKNLADSKARETPSEETPSQKPQKPPKSQKQKTLQKPGSGKSKVFQNGLFVIAIFIFLGAAGMAGGLLYYQGTIQDDISQKSDQLAAARGEINTEAVSEYQRLEARLTQAGELLENHQALSPFFTLLERNTLQSVRYTNFEYTSGGGGNSGSQNTANSNSNVHSVSLSGEADSYQALARQSQLFLENELIRRSSFSGIQLTQNGELVEFQFTAQIAPSVFEYEPSDYSN